MIEIAPVGDRSRRAAPYGDHVLVIEYRRQDFTAGCTQWGNRLSIVLRDVDLVPQGAAGYVFDGC